MITVNSSFHGSGDYCSCFNSLNNDLEENDFSNFNCIWSELSKTVQDLKIGRSLANGPP